MCYLLSGEHHVTFCQVSITSASSKWEEEGGSYNYVQHAPSFNGNISVTAMYQWRSHLSQMLLQNF